MVNVRSCEIPRSVLQADTIVVSCGLANFEQSSWSTHPRHEFWGRMKNCTEGETTTSSSQCRGQLTWNVRRSFSMDDRLQNFR